VTGLYSGLSSELSFDVVGADSGIGIAGGGSNLIQSSANEYLRIDFTNKGQNFGASLADFGTYGSFYIEIVEFRFYLDGTQVSNAFGVACNVDGGLASFLVPVGTDFNRVEIAPVPAFEVFSGTLSGITALLVSEVRVCPAGEVNCRTTLDAPANRCS